MHRYLASLFFAFASITPVAAHENHDQAVNSVGNPVWHYLTEPDHFGPVILISAVILVGMVSVLKLRGTGRIARSLNTDQS